ncbi:ATP-binding protein [Leptotrichia sp. oral taxon 223]|uniref:ATP-binding protein n=1 Tax=Leptotrichia sp. oral taxon 223 TaxID=712363 RepID=UPI0015BF0DA9|nr:ATP-binding protein [Leptotrichia sp. oral taxon 223]NWO19133.1 ATP-binding protein [Leptotrichia sp. oral taxon 223]
MIRIDRKEYLDILVKSKDRQIIKVVSGVRRCGKSTLFEIYKDFLLENGVAKNQIISINFEDMDYEELTDYKKLYEYIKSKLIEDKRNYIFLDEIQHVDKFEKVVDSLFIKENTDLYITGSNAYFMSSELATLLSGRYIELKMLPLSFKEYYQAKLEYEKLEQKENRISKTLIQYYNEYIVNSSFPYTLQLDSDLKNIHEYLSGIYNSVLLKDIVARLKISDVMRLESVVKYIFDNIGNLTSLSKIGNTLTSMGRKTDVKTIEKYIRGLTDSLLVHEVSRYNIKGKEFLSTLSTYYVADLGLRQMILGNRNIDMGHILENIIYLELLRRKGNVYVGQFDKNEIDFVVINSNEIEYYQVALTVLDENTLKRELDTFKNIKDNYPKYLITLDDVMVNTDYDGIKVINALEWLLWN